MKLNDLSVIFDCPHSTAPDEGWGYPLIRTPNVGKGRLILDGVHRVSKATYDIRNKRAIPQENDIIFAREAPAGNAALITKGQLVCLGQRTVLIRPNTDQVDPRYLVYYLLDPHQQARLLGFSHGATVGHVNIPDIANLSVNLPSLKTQSEIADIIDKYENLLDVNNKRIKALEQMAENLYKEWFVRFRFPGHETAKFENGIPKGWEIKRLSDIANVVMGQSPPSEYYNMENIGLPFHQGVGSYGDIYLDDSIYSTEGKRVAEPNSIIFSVRAPVGRINITLNRIVLGRGVASINSKANRNAFLYWQLKSTFATEDVIGNGAIFASVTKDELLQQKMLVPDIDKQILFDSFAKKIEKQIRCYYLSNKNLIKQRDLLLPRLMSGKLEV